MALSSRDALGTAFVAAAGGVVAWHLAAPDAAFVGSARWTGLAVFVLGLFGCASGARMEPADRYVQVMGLLASVPFLLMLAVLVTGSDGVLLAFALSVAAMWLGTTIRHATMPPPEEPDRAAPAPERELVDR